MILRTKAGLLLERLLSTMHDWQGYALRHLLCYNGEDANDAYDCACCITWPDDDQYGWCGCICHERIEKMANSGDMPLLFSALVMADAFPKFAASFEELKAWKQSAIDNKKVAGSEDDCKAGG